MTPPSDALNRFVARAGKLYSLPGVAIKVLDLANNPTVDARALKECIENDPALTTKILRVVNSSLFGLSRAVSDLNQALALLGTKPLKLLVLGFSLPDRLFVGLAADVLGKYWRHTLTKSVAAREISRAFWDRDGDEPFIAGLLQDIGMLLLLQELGEPYARFLDRVAAEQGDLAALEAASLGFDHVQLSARLLDRWGLPEPIVRAIVASRSPIEIGALPPRERVLAQVLALAERLTAIVADDRRDVLGELLKLGREYCHLAEDRLDALVATLEEKVRQLADVLSLSLPEGIQYRDVLSAAHAQLSDVAAEVTADVVRADRARRSAGASESAILEQTQALSAAVAKFAGGGIGDGERGSASAERPIHAALVIGSKKVSATARNVATPGAATSAGVASSSVAVPSSASTPRRAARHETMGRDPLAPADVNSVDADPGLAGRVAAAVNACRQSHRPLSLLLVEVDRYADVAFAHGPATAVRFVELLRAICRSVDHPKAECVASREAQCAVILPNCDRDQAVELAGELVRGVRQLGDRHADADKPTMSVSIGVATVTVPPRNFPAAQLIDSADRCLYGAKSSGGNGLKSIGIY